MRRRVDFRLPVDLLARVDGARGDASRTLYVERALELLLDRGSRDDGASDSAQVTQQTVKVSRRGSVSPSLQRFSGG